MSMIRWVRFLIANAIVLFSISFIFHVGIASANDIGTVTIQGASMRADYDLSAGAVIGGAATSWNRIYYNSANVNHLVDFKIVAQPVWTASHNSNASAFTITSGGTGTGYISYDNKLANASEFAVYYFFDNNVVLTSSPITITLDNNILNDISVVGGQNPFCGAEALSTTKPVAVWSGGGGGCGANPYQASIIYSRVNVGTLTNNSYNVSYNNNNSFGFIFNLTKESIATKVQLYDDNGNIYFTEGTFNTAYINYLNATNMGLTVNISVADGTKTIKLINHSPSYINSNVPSQNTQNGVGMVWEFNTYTIDTTGNLSWSKTTPSLACDNIKIYNPSGSLISTITNPNNAGIYKVMLDKAGTWKAEYIRQTICVLSNEEVLNTAYTTVPAPEASYLVINATTIAGKFENVTYRSGTRNPILAPQLKVLDAFGNLEGSFDISGFQINVEGISPVVIITSGQHTIRICDAWGCDDAVAVTNTVFNQSIPTTDITTSNITMDSSVYSFEDHAIVKYAVDNTNFSNKAIYTTSFNWNYGIETTRYVGFVNQTGTLDEHLSLFRGRYTYPGNYSYRLMGRNDTGAYILAFWNFSISSIDNEGYGLSLSKETLCLGESLTLIVNSPAISYMNISHNTNGNIFNSYSINMNKTISYKPSAAGTYSVILYSPEGYTKRAFTFDVSACVTPTPTPGATQGATQAKAMANMLMSNIFWSFIITAGLMIAIAWRTKHGMATVGMGALSMTVFASIGWFPLWAFFSIVIIAALLLSAKWASQFFDIGTSD